MKLSYLFISIGIGLLSACTQNDADSSKSSVVIEKPEVEEGFELLDDGRKIRVERAGNGEEILESNLLIFHYKEWLLPNRRKINDTYENRRPSVVRLGNKQLTVGLEKTILEHRVGAVFQVEVPWELGYGDSVYLDYPPKRNLMYDVSLIGVKEAVPVYDTSGIKPEYTMSGLEIYRIKKGSGSKIKKGEYVQVLYHGYFEDGNFFDSSYDRESPIGFEVGSGQVIPGWDEVIQRMQVGEKVHVKIPFFLAYGESGRGPIPPKSDLHFDMEIVSVKR